MRVVVDVVRVVDAVLERRLRASSRLPVPVYSVSAGGTPVGDGGLDGGGPPIHAVPVPGTRIVGGKVLVPPLLSCVGSRRMPLLQLSSAPTVASSALRSFWWLRSWRGSMYVSALLSSKV